MMSQDVSGTAFNTRQQILTLLKRSGPGLTADDLAQQLRISAVAVRKHLATLEREDLVMAELQRRPMGRPTYRYRPDRQSPEVIPR